MQTTDTPTPLDVAGQTCEGLPAKSGSARIHYAPRPDAAGWWYDCKMQRWRWCFDDPGMGLCARENKSIGHFWRVSNYKAEEKWWYGPVWMPNDSISGTGGVAQRPAEAGDQPNQDHP